MNNISERDWKAMQAMKDDVLNLACEYILNQIEKVMSDRAGKEYETYLKIWDLMREEDEDIRLMFDDFRRSNAMIKLLAWKNRGLISDEQFATLSEKTQQKIKMIAS